MSESADAACGAGTPSSRQPVHHEPAAALAWSEARINRRDIPGPALALWQPEGVTVALGIGQRPEVEVDTEGLARDGVGLIRRQSGGGAVLLFSGVVCWEAWMTTEELVRRGGPEGAGIRPSYAELCRPVINGLACHGVDAFHAGICDISTISTDGSLRKLAGTAQLRRKDMVLVHGSLLVNADLAQLGQYLRFPSEQPDYRRDRSHADFCATVSSLVSGVAPEELMESLCGAVARAALADGWEVLTPPTELDAEARALFEQKYTSENWNWKKVRPPSSTGVAADRRER